MIEAQPFTTWGARLRPMQAADVEAVLAIEKRNFPAPWTRRAFLAEIAATSVSQPLVAEYQNQIIGYVVPWFVADELQIANIAIHEDFRRRGLARQIIVCLCDAAPRRGCRVAHLEVRRSNTAARMLYEKLGFQTTKVRRNYYEPGEDALLMSKQLDFDSVESMERKENGLV
jgi:ribosomal-protein-alanine N-acetyltransferase